MARKAVLAATPPILRMITRVVSDLDIAGYSFFSPA
jgi:hypothetical protein